MESAMTSKKIKIKSKKGTRRKRRAQNYASYQVVSFVSRREWMAGVGVNSTRVRFKSVIRREEGWVWAVGLVFVCEGDSPRS
jgi:hypothetical protein